MAIRHTFSPVRPAWRLAALLALAALIVLPSIAPAQSPPGTPSSVTVTRSGDTLTATWPAPNGATKYHVTYTADAGQTWTAAAGPDDGHAANTIDITGIDTTKIYVVAVRAGNEHGWSSWRNSAPNGPNAPPAQPGTITVTRADGSLIASWGAVADATRYHVTYTVEGSGNWLLAALDHTESSITITGVDNAKTYIVAVRAGNDAGWGGWRNSAPAGPWTQPPPPPAAPAKIWVERVCDHTLIVWWERSDGATGYDLNASKDGRRNWLRMMTNKNKNGFKFSVWGKNTTLWFAVRAVNAGGESAWVNSEAAPPPPCEADNLRAVGHTTHGTAGGSITATWDAAKRATTYHVNHSPNGVSHWTRMASNISATTHTGTVTARGDDVVAVRSLNGDLGSEWRNADVAWLTASVTDVAATLTLAGHSGNWYVKQTAPTPGTCSAAGSGTTHTLPVTADTTHTFTAYSDADCATAIATTTIPILPGLAVSNVTASTATLTLTGHSGNWYVETDRAHPGRQLFRRHHPRHPQPGRPDQQHGLHLRRLRRRHLLHPARLRLFRNRRAGQPLFHQRY